MKHTTTREMLNDQYEPLPMYGWRCGMYSLEPELQRHRDNGEFMSGLRSGRKQRLAVGGTQGLANILSLPNLREMRRSLQHLYNDISYKSKLAASAARASIYSNNRVSCIGRSYADAYLDKSDTIYAEAEGLQQEYNNLQNEYRTELERLCELRGIKSGYVNA